MSIPTTTELVMTYREAIRAAMEDAMQADPTVLLLGEDVAGAGGAFKTSEGLLERFGPKRVMDTPIAENSFTGAALGMAITGMRPIVEIMFADFLPTAGDALVNEIPKFRLISGGQTTVPLTIRAIGGGTLGFGTQHSATGESWFLQVPGWRIVTASTPSSAYELLRMAIALEDPVLFIEHKALYNRKGPVARVRPQPEVGRATIMRPGTDVTIVATLLMVERALSAADTLTTEGIQAEVIDLRWLTPLDTEMVAQSVARTGHLVVAEEQVHQGGWGATLISLLAQAGSGWSRPEVVSLPFAPVAYSPPLEAAAIPSVERITAAARRTVLDY